MDIEQVMGPQQASAEMGKLAPKFVFNGENPGKFMREFPFVAEYYGIAEALTWPDDKELDEKDQRRDVFAQAILRQYISEDCWRW